MPALPGYYTLVEAAEKLGYATTSYLARRCGAGQIPAIKVGKTWFVPESWITEQEASTPKGQGNRGVARK